MGGLSKKAFLIKGLINDPRLPALVVTGGNLLFPGDQLAPEGAERERIAADGLLQATRKMGATFAGVASRDLAAGIGFLQKYQQPPAFTWLSVNLVDASTQRPRFPPTLFSKLGGVKIAILALTDHVPFTKGTQDFMVLHWRDSLPDALAKAEKDADFIVLLSNYSFNENTEIAKKFGKIDLILQAGHAIGNMIPIPVNNALIAQAEIRGKYLGVLDIDWQGRGAWSEAVSTPQEKNAKPAASTYNNRFIALKQSLTSDPEIETLIKQTQARMDKSPQGRTP